ncbi:Zn-ribbon domain-containing OB-fold protein [Gordonia namibiensis]|uniref:Zn-ribbon domain-containing OB-fold protein n=1 Tax=Gordonia namibiensis TaxID=168480 RepID=UPI0002D3554D|nr:OB-fold domain-containing protein [Gordonia namibiensis]
MHPEDFVGIGVVWSRTTIHIAVGDHVPPYTVAYVDLDNGPRVLAQASGETVDVGARVRLVGLTSSGDPHVEEVRR